MSIPDLEKMRSVLEAGHQPISFLAPGSNLQERFERLDPVQAAAIFAGLLTSPRVQANSYRIEALLHLALALGRGRQKPSDKLVARSFEELGNGICGMLEDPPEDMFVAAIRCPLGNFRIIQGIWEGAAFYLQRFLDVLTLLPDITTFNHARGSVLALLRLSELVCERAGLDRWQMGGDLPRESLDRKLQNALTSYKHRVRFRVSELEATGITLANLEPFLLDSAKWSTLSHQSLGLTSLERKPLVLDGPFLWVMLPTAISVAIRRFIIESAQNSGLGEILSRALEATYAHLFYETPLLGGRCHAPISFRNAERSAIAEVTTEIDAGRYVHYLFFTDRLMGFEETGLIGMNPDEAAIGPELSARIESAHHWATKRSGFRDGMTIIVGCGVGRGGCLKFDRGDWPSWRIEAIPSHDFYTLSWTREFCPLTLWRILEAREHLEHSGTTLMNINGLINLVGWAQSLDGHLVPHRHLPESVPEANGSLMVVIDQASLRRVRFESATTFDPRVELDADGVWRRLRHHASSIFDDDRHRPTYASEDPGESGRPMVAYLAPRRTWWADVFTGPSVPGEIAFGRWEMIEVWLSRAAPVLDSLTGLPPGPIHWNAIFEETATHQNNENLELTYDGARAALSVTVDVSRRTVTTTASSTWEMAQLNIENIAERALIAALIDGVADLSSTDLGEEVRAALLFRIIPTPQARQGHAFRQRNFRDFVLSDLPQKVIKITKEDDAIIRLGLGWQAHAPKDGNEIEGIAGCTSFLNGLVRNMETDLCTELQRFNRRHLVTAILYNAEAAAVDRDRWRRTASAVLALHDNRQETLAKMAQHEFGLNAVFMASRNLIEMVICECPLEGGDFPGELDISRLMAKASLLFGTGGMSDAIRWELMPPKLRITLLGDVHGDFGWMKEVVAPFAREASDIRVMAEARDYAKNLRERTVYETLADRFDPLFLDAWREQFGASLDETRILIDFVEDIGIESGKAVVEVPRSRFQNIEVAGQSLEEPAASRIIDELTSLPRACWRETPLGFEDRDRFPWRLRRRLSILRRPLIQIDRGADPTILVAPGILREAFAYSFSTFFRGDFPDNQLSPKMKAWRAKTVGKRGTLLAQEVESRMRALGWSTRIEINVTELLGRRLDRNYGDVDVLAWQRGNARVLVIECKDVQYRKSEGEIAEQLADFRGKVRADGSRDELRKHLDRVDVLRAHLTEISAFTGLRDLLDIESYLLFRNPVPMKYALLQMSEKVRVCHLDDVEAIWK